MFFPIILRSTLKQCMKALDKKKPTNHSSSQQENHLIYDAINLFLPWVVMPRECCSHLGFQHPDSRSSKMHAESRFHTCCILNFCYSSGEIETYSCISFKDFLKVGL